MSPTYFEEGDVTAMIEDSPDAVDVTIGSTTVKGLRDTVDPEVLAGEGTMARGKQREVSVATDSLPGLAKGAAITVEGESFKVSDFEQVEDGALTVIRVREAL